MMMHADLIYLDGALEILEKGNKRKDRTGTGTISRFGIHRRYNLEDGFPLLTTKFVSFRLIAHELLWFLSGSTNIKYLLDNNVKIWNGDAYRHFRELNPDTKLSQEEFVEWVRSTGRGYDLGPIYGKQWRTWEGVGITVDQIAQVIESIKNDPYSRRHIVSAWNPGEIHKMALPPCHVLFQFYVEDGKLSCQLYQRSADYFLGVPFNIASYALLTHMIAQLTGLGVGEFVHTIGDAHIYLNHVDQIKEQLRREPRDMPTIKINPDITGIDQFTIDDFTLEGYNPHPRIRGELSNG